MAEESSLDQALARIVGPPSSAAPSAAPGVAPRSVLGTTVTLEGTPPPEAPSPFAAQIAATQANIDAIKARTAALAPPPVMPVVAPAVAAAPAPVVYDPAAANQAAKIAYDAAMDTYKPMISIPEWKEKSAAYQRAMWDKAVREPGSQTYGLPSYSGSGPQVDIFTPPPPELQTQASRAGFRAFREGMGYTRPEFRALARPERQALRQQYQAPPAPTSPYWTK